MTGIRADRIELKGLRAMAVVGVLDHEKLAPQPVEIDLALDVDLRSAGATDDLVDTVDYGAITDACMAALTEPAVLLETAAARLAEVALGDPRVTGVEVAIRKLRPPVAHDLGTAGVRIFRP
ncbi:MAG TPA: dihydroneopterin aldolase [Acidimicrobiales bacterium]|nr:dihydroneopterin aldolase [Acidimicrobiales bacterium]